MRTWKRVFTKPFSQDTRQGNCWHITQTNLTMKWSDSTPKGLTLNTPVQQTVTFVKMVLVIRDGEYNNVREVFKWLSKVIAWLRLLRQVIGYKISRQFFNQWETNPKPIAPCAHDYFSRPLSRLQVIARNSDWFIALFAPNVIGRVDYFGIGFSTAIWKPFCSVIVCLSVSWLDLESNVSAANFWSSSDDEVNLLRVTCCDMLVIQQLKATSNLSLQSIILFSLQRM